MMNGKYGRRKKIRFNWEMIGRAVKSTTARSCYVLVATALLLTILLFFAITPKRYDLKVGDIAPTTITASKDVVDQLSTERQRDAAASQVEPTYVFKEGVAAEVKANLNVVLDEARQAQEYGQSVLSVLSGGDGFVAARYYFSEAELKKAREYLTSLTLADYQLQTLLHMDSQTFADLASNITAAVGNSLNSTIREGYVNDSIQVLQQMIAYKTDIAVLQNVVTPILRKVIQPNMVIDQEATEKLRDEARAAVEPVIYKQGQNIVLARELVTVNQLEMLRDLGMLDDDKVDMTTYVGGSLIVMVGVFTLLITLLLFDPGALQNIRKVLIEGIVICLTFGLCILGRLLHAYMTPTLLCAMMLTCLVGARAACAGALSVSVAVCALIAGSDASYGAAMVNMMFTTIIGSLWAVYILHHQATRQQILIAGLMSAVTHMAVILSVGFMTSKSVSDVFTNALWSAGGAIVSAVLCIAFCPLFETLFHLATTSKLLELSNPNHPLLRRLMIEAAGTYHHSIMVANLAEAAAEAIQANPLMARVGAYFHDIGKLKRPMYFKENQRGENIHDNASPYVSAAVLTAHTHDGVLLAQQNHLPREIQSIIEEHHGDTPVAYFYHKALQMAGGQSVDIDDFRYTGHKPHTRESAIIMLADTVEAAVRSMTEPTPEAIRKFIKKLIWGKLEDGQLDQAPITLKDLTAIQEAFCTSLNGVYHERIEYPGNAEMLEGPSEEGPSAENGAAAQETAVETAKETKAAAEKESGNEIEKAVEKKVETEAETKAPLDENPPVENGQADSREATR